MDMILAGVKWHIWLVYLDDVIVVSRPPEAHSQHLDEVLTLLGKAGVTLKASKCHFFQDAVESLGNVIRPGRVHVLEKNLRALRGLRYPETQTQMKSFLGTCGVHHRFVSDFAKIAKPLTALTSTKLPKKLPPPSREEMDAFEILRGRLLDAPILALPMRHGHYIVDVDASYEPLGFCLQQQQSDGEYHPIGYYSRALLPAEKNSFATEIEPLGVVLAVTYLRSYVEGAEFVVRCDHRALKVEKARCSSAPRPNLESTSVLLPGEERAAMSPFSIQARNPSGYPRGAEGARPEISAPVGASRESRLEEDVQQALS